VKSLSDLVSRYELPLEAERQLRALLEVVAADPEAPTSVCDPAEAVDAHLADSLVALEIPAVRAARAVADLGAGAGFPGLALAVALPEARVALVESSGRKCAFMARAAEAAGLGNAEVVHARAEEWREGLATRDLVTARALAPLPVIAEYAAPLLAPGGALVAWKGRRDPDEEAAGDAAAAELGLGRAEVREVQPFSKAQHRHLHLYLKVGSTPDRFPRRPGIARKRPLG